MRGTPPPLLFLFMIPGGSTITNDTELREYAASITASTIEMVTMVRALRDALTDALEDEESCAVAIQSAKETRDALIRDTFRIGLTPFMQPAAEMDEPEEEAGGETEAEAAGRTRAGRTPQNT